MLTSLFLQLFFSEGADLDGPVSMSSTDTQETPGHHRQHLAEVVGLLDPAALAVGFHVSY